MFCLTRGILRSPIRSKSGFHLSLIFFSLSIHPFLSCFFLSHLFFNLFFKLTFVFFTLNFQKDLVIFYSCIFSLLCLFGFSSSHVCTCLLLHFFSQLKLLLLCEVGLLLDWSSRRNDHQSFFKVRIIHVYIYPIKCFLYTF